MSDAEDRDEIAHLRAAGDLGRAAGLLERSGRWKEALELYESLWDFDAAARVAREAGDLPLALRNTLRADDRASLEAIAESSAEADSATQQRCAAVCEERGALSYAGLFRERAGQLELAADRYEQAGLLGRAARLCERLGDARRAISLYRRQLERDAAATATAPEAIAQRERDCFDLARLLLRHGRQAEAIPLLQPIWQAGSALQRDAGIACVSALQRAGYAHAARATLEALQSQFPDLRSVDCCVDDERFSPLESDADSVVLAGRYRLDDLIGSGGMSRVYRAHDLVVDRAVAIKVFTALGGSRGREGRRRFVREALVTGKLDHPHIVICHDYSDDGFIVLEYMGGGSLAARVQPPLSVPACRAIALQVISGLLAAHQRGIVHRDVKPSNIFFNEAGVAKIGDFGIAHLQDQGLTQTGAFVGTLAFMAPEQIRGEAVTFATDIYALGATLHVMLTGSHPYEPPGVLQKHLEAPVARPSARDASLPAICDEIVARCMAKAPDDRYRSLDALQRDIERLPGSVVLEAAPPDDARDVEPRPTPSPTLSRYLAEGQPRRCGCLETQAARDGHLARPVILVRLPPPSAQPHAWELLRAAARGDEHLQRVLSLDPDAGLAILAAPPDLPDPPPSSPVSPLELCHRLARALIPLHEAGLGHGAIDARAIIRIGRFHELALVPALEKMARAQSTLTSTEQLASDVNAVARLAGVDLPAELPDASALACWAEDEQRRVTAIDRQERHEAALRRALASAPAAVSARGLGEQRDD